MWFRSLLSSLKSPRPATRVGAASRRPTSRLQVEPLEDRSLPSAYVLTDLGGFSSTDLNASAQIVGSTGNGRASLWNQGTVTDLGTFGGPTSLALHISDRGQVVGEASTAAGSNHAFLITPLDTDGNGTPDLWFRDANGDGINDLMLDLGTLGGSDSAAVGVNNAGQVVGWLETLAGPYDAFLWQNGTMTDLSELGASGTGFDINDAGQILLDHGLWQNGAFATGAGGGVAINNSGTVVISDGYAWTPDQPNGTVGTVAALAPLPGGISTTAVDVNDAGLIIGSSVYVVPGSDDGPYGFVPDSYASYPVVWQNGVPTDLNSLVVGAPGITVDSVDAINATGQIAGNDVLLTPTNGPVVSVSDVSVVEGNSGTRAANFTVTLTSTSSQPVTVQYSTANGTATAGSDYQATSGTLTIPAGQTSGTIAVLVDGDRLPEANETFFVNLTGATNAVIAHGQGTGTIVDDDPRIGISDVAKNEGNTGTTQFVFTVSLSVAYDVPVSVNFATADGTATAGGNYKATSGTLTIPAGQTSGTVTVLVNGDRLPEPNETFFVNLSNPVNAAIAIGQGKGLILDDEPLISISNVAKNEGKRGQTTSFTFTVTLSAAYDQAVTMSFRTVDSTATTGDSDYVAKTGTITFNPGETTKTITIVVNGDGKKESDETFYMDLFGNSSNSLFSKSRGTGTILNDD